MDDFFDIEEYSPKSYGGLIISDNKVLLREPTNHFGGYVWTFPKGESNKGEKPEETALREVFEETGIRGKIIKFIDIPFTGDSSDAYFFIMKPLYQTGTFDFETTNIKWVTYNQAIKLVSQNHPSGATRDLNILSYLKQNNYLT